MILFLIHIFMKLPFPFFKFSKFLAKSSYETIVFNFKLTHFCLAGCCWGCTDHISALQGSARRVLKRQRSQKAELALFCLIPACRPPQFFEEEAISSCLKLWSTEPALDTPALQPVSPPEDSDLQLLGAPLQVISALGLVTASRRCYD